MNQTAVTTNKKTSQKGLTFTQLGLALLVPALFFEADQFSLLLPFGRVRLYHVLIVALFASVLWQIASGKKSWRKTPLDWPLLVYVALNWGTVALAPDYAIGFKIAGLITLLALLYWTVTNSITTREDFLRHARLLFWSVLASALFGLFQVFAVWLASRTDITLWNGTIIHSDILPYGRPYGTFVEPDWFGTISAAAFAGVAVLSFSHAFKQRQVELLCVSFILFVATVLSGVRGGWLAAGVALPLALVLSKVRFKQLNLGLVAKVTVFAAVVSGIVLAFTPAIREALQERVLTLGTSSTLEVEPRFLIMEDGWELFLEHPWLGRGPGAYTSLGTIPFVSGMTAAIHGIENFQTNALLTILIDTGLVGLAIVLLMLWRAARLAWRSILAEESQKVAATLFSLGTAAVALGIGYQVSSGIWLGLTWYLGSLIIAGSLLSQKVSVTPSKTHASKP